MDLLKLFIFCLVTLTAALLLSSPIEAGGDPCEEAHHTFLLEENLFPEPVRGSRSHASGHIHATTGPPMGAAGYRGGPMIPPASVDSHRLSILRI